MRKKHRKRVGEAVSVVEDHLDDAVAAAGPLMNDAKFRALLVSALAASTAARERVQLQLGAMGAVRRLAADPVLRTQLADVASAVRDARQRARIRRRRNKRTVVVAVLGLAAVATAPTVRSKVGVLVAKLRPATRVAAEPEGQASTDVMSQPVGDSPTTTNKADTMANSDQVTGKLKEAEGDLTGDERLKREGEVEQTQGAVKKKIDKAADALKDKV